MNLPGAGNRREALIPYFSNLFFMKEKRNSKLRYAAVDQVPTVAYCSYSRREINETTFKY